MNDPGVRKGLNEVWFRDLNEKLEDRAVEQRGLERFEIVCECAREECTVRIMMSVAEYEAVRADPDAFILAKGHTDASAERVVFAQSGYDVVEKFGSAAAVAEADDPRDGD